VDPTPIRRQPGLNIWEWERNVQLAVAGGAFTLAAAAFGASFLFSEFWPHLAAVSISAFLVIVAVVILYLAANKGGTDETSIVPIQAALTIQGRA